MGQLGFIVMAIGSVVSLSYYNFDMWNMKASIPDWNSRWWGPGETGIDKPSIIPFQINVTDEQLNYLRNRLETVPLIKPLDDGFNKTNYLKKIIHFWLNDYNWRSREKYFNSLPQYITQVDGLNIHYIHVKPTKLNINQKVYPLLMLHGWSASVREFYEIIPMLTRTQSNQNFIFEIIAPSLPGFGFSQTTTKQELSSSQMAIILNDLMEKLGYEKYFLHGGGHIVQHMATIFPKKLMGLHSTNCIVHTRYANWKLILGNFFPSLIGLSDRQYNQLYPIKKLIKNLFLETEQNLHHIQSIKPDTLGIALSDSPVGLAAYILEKYTIWTNLDHYNLSEDDLTKHFQLTDLIDNLMIYWINKNSISSSLRFFRESYNPSEIDLHLDNIPTHIPTVCVQMPYNLSYNNNNNMPLFVLKDKFTNLIDISELSDGGYFILMENPKILKDNIYQSIEKIINTK